MNKDTRIHLVEELEKLPRTPGIEFIIKEAKAGEYHDYKNQKYDCGKIAVVNLLRDEGLNNLAERVIDGEFDEMLDAEDLKRLRSIVPEKMWPVFGLDKDIK